MSKRVKILARFLLFICCFNLSMDAVFLSVEALEVVQVTRSLDTAKDETKYLLNLNVNDSQKMMMSHMECHFGHCSHHTVSFSPEMPHNVLAEKYIVINLLCPQTPFLKGPKHPPRFV